MKCESAKLVYEPVNLWLAGSDIGDKCGEKLKEASSSRLFLMLEFNIYVAEQ